jgi:hypothetical protein
VRDSATARRLLAALGERAELLDDGTDRATVVISAGDRAFALNSLQRLLDTIADEHAVDDWSEYLQAL